jgi:uncharacterized protein
MKLTLQQKLNRDTGAKRILCLDGGGIRGALTLGFVKKIEHIIRKKHNDPSMVLADYFDFIGGTSTGAIIAAALATGKTADYIANLYQTIGGDIFGKRNISGYLGAIGKLLKSTYKKSNLENALKKEFGDIELCGPEILTGLCIVLKRADTYGTWPLVNHPETRFNKNGDNSKLLLRQLVRASAAAPTFFPVEQIKIDAKGQEGIFVDGGVSMLNNPSLMMFLMATTFNNFKFNWQKGDDKILLVSLGTGYRKRKLDLDKIDDLGYYWAGEVPEMLMYDANKYNQMILQSMSDTVTPNEIDLEIGDMKKDKLTTAPLLTYLRYNVEFTDENLTSLGFANTDIDDLCQMDDAGNRQLLAAVGTAASIQINENHFADKFNIPL